MTENLPHCAHCGLALRVTVESEKTARYVHVKNNSISCGLADRGLMASVDDSQAGLFDLLDSGPYTRRSDPDTSHLAAKQMTAPKISRLKQWVLEALQLHGPMTHEEMYDTYLRTAHASSMSGHKEQSVRSRCNELVKDHGLVMDSGLRRKMRDGNQAIVWTLCNNA